MYDTCLCTDQKKVSIWHAHNHALQVEIGNDKLSFQIACSVVAQQQRVASSDNTAVTVPAIILSLTDYMLGLNPLSF